MIHPAPLRALPRHTDRNRAKQIKRFNRILDKKYVGLGYARAEGVVRS